jgi:hypothetical protein
VLGLIEHLAQATDIQPAPLVVPNNIVKVMECPDRTLFNTLASGSTIGVLATAGLGVPITPPLKGVLVVAVESTVLFLRLAWSNLDRSPIYLCTQ